jgi:acyl-CoA thioesterase FadM
MLSRAAVKALLGGSTPPLSLFETTTQTLRAWPWLCDSLGHINNARYLDLASWGRIEWLARAGLLRPSVRKRFSPIIAATSVVYRRSIPRMASFSLETRLAGFDARWLYHEQTFLLGAEAGGKTAARVLARLQIQQHGKGVNPEQALQAVGLELPSTRPTPPADFDSWLAAQDACLNVVRARDAR